MNSTNIEAFWVSLLGFWLSYSLATFGICCTRLHWFIKFLAIAGLAGALLFIEAPDLMLMVLSQCLTIFLTLSVGRAWTAREVSRSEPNVEKTPAGLPQIRLLNAMLGVAALCILLTAAQVDLLEAPRFGWFEHIPLVYCLPFGVSLGLVSVLALWLANLKLRWVLAINTIACAAGAIAIPKIIFRPEGVTVGLAFLWGELPDFAISILIANAIAIVLLCVTWRLSCSNKVWIKRVARSVCALMIAAMIFLTAGTVYLYNGLLNGPQVVWPDQQAEQINGFDELVAAGRQFDKSRLLIFPKIAATRAGVTLQQELDAYALQFEQAERALKRPLLTSAVSSIDEYDSFHQDYNYFRRVALAFDCRAIQHLHEGDYDSALNDACLIAELSVPLRRGNSVSYVLPTPAIEQMGHFQATRCVPDASFKSLKLAIVRLARVELSDQCLDDVYENDIAIEWVVATWQHRLQILIREAQVDDHFDYGMLENTRYGNSIRRQAITLMAIELFRRQKKRYPPDLDSLVPGFLDSVPMDPFSVTSIKKPLRYQLNEDGSSFNLYSVGPDLVDNDGKIGPDGVTRINEKGDINLAASVKYKQATTDAERKALTIPES